MGNISSLIGQNQQPYVKPSGVDYNTTTNKNLLPAGWYTATIENADVRPNRAGTGSFLEVEFSIEGRRIREYLNIQHANPAAQEIGLRELAKLQDVCGIPQLDDSEQFIAKTLSVRVIIKEDPNYGLVNRINGFAKLDDKYENSTFRSKSGDKKLHDVRQKIRGNDIDPTDIPF